MLYFVMSLRDNCRAVGLLLGGDVGSGDASVNEEGAARHVGRLVRCEEEGAVGDLVRLTEPPHRDVHKPPLLLGFRVQEGHQQLSTKRTRAWSSNKKHE